MGVVRAAFDELCEDDEAVCGVLLDLGLPQVSERSSPVLAFIHLRFFF